MFFFVIFTIVNGWNTIYFIFFLCVTFILFLAAVGKKENPFIREIDSGTDGHAKIITDSLSPAFDELVKHNFKLYHRELTNWSVYIIYKRNGDDVIFSFSYHPLDFPYEGVIILSKKNFPGRSFASLCALKNSYENMNEKLVYSLNSLEDNEFTNTMTRIKNDFLKYSRDFLEGDYSRIKDIYKKDKKFYKGWWYLFSRI